MSQTHLVIPDIHAHPSYSNERADWLSKLIIDVSPDVVIQIGDAADMESLCSYDKGKRAFHGRSYKKDIDAHLEFQERLWGPVRRRKKKLPRTVFLEGNHEHRIEKALDLSPELQGTIGLKDLDLDRYYDEVIRYKGQTPGQVCIDGVTYAHYFVSGIMGRALSGKHPAYSLVSVGGTSCTAGHSHLADFHIHSGVNGKKTMGLVCGVYQDYDSEWAGVVNNLWWRGVVIKRNVENGVYDVQFVSLDSLNREYGN